MESSRPAIPAPAPGADPTTGLVLRPRQPGARAGVERGRVLATATTVLLHAAVAVVLLAGGPSRTGAAVPASVAEEGRVQLRFASAVSEGAAAPVPFQAMAPAHARTLATSSPTVTPPAVAAQPAGENAAPATDSMAATWRTQEAAPPVAAAPAEPGQGSGPAVAAAYPGGGQGHHPGPGAAHASAGQDTPSAASRPAQAGVEADWAASVMRRLEQFRTYPAAARHHRAEGVVLVQATIGADGRVLDTRLRSSCGNADLDAEALATFARARRVPAPPSHLPSPLQVDLPVSFLLRS